MTKKMAFVITLVAVLTFPIEKTNFQHSTEVYTVQPGDTLWAVAEHYSNHDERGLYFLQFKEEIVKDNPFLKNRSGVIYPGDKIVVTVYKRTTE